MVFKFFIGILTLLMQISFKWLHEGENTNEPSKEKGVQSIRDNHGVLDSPQKSKSTKGGEAEKKGIPQGDRLKRNDWSVRAESVIA